MGYHIELEVKGELTEEGVDIFNKIESGGVVTDIGSPYIKRHENNRFYLQKYERYQTDLQETYEKFVKNFLVPLTKEITDCCIKEELFDTTNFYTDDELRKARYLVAYTEPPSPKVQYGKRVAAVKSKPKLLSYTKIYPIVYDSDVDTWPIGLRGNLGWWHNLHKENALVISGALRKYYPDDEGLMKTADWIDEVMGKFSDVDFQFRYEFDLKN
jgi:hypothetical protein